MLSLFAGTFTPMGKRISRKLLMPIISQIHMYMSLVISSKKSFQIHR